MLRAAAPLSLRFPPVQRTHVTWWVGLGLDQWGWVGLGAGSGRSSAGEGRSCCPRGGAVERGGKTKVERRRV